MLSERQQQILDESIKLIDEKGIQGFTIKNLSKKIGVSEPAIYRHFESKFEIMNTLLDIFKQRVMLNHETILKQDINPYEKLRLFLKNTLQSLTSNPAIVTVIFSEEIFQNEKSLSDKVFEIQKLNEEFTTILFNEIKLNNSINTTIDSEIFNLLIFGSLRLVVKKWKHMNYSFDLIEKGNYLFNTIINLLK